MGEMSLEESSLEESTDRIPAGRRLPAAPHYRARRDAGPLHIQSVAPVARMAFVVNSIKAGFRKLGAGVLASEGHIGGSGGRGRRRPNAQTAAGYATGGDGGASAARRRAGGNVLGVKRKAREFDNESRSFEVFLSSLPKADPVDRTVNWLFHQHHPPEEEVKERRKRGGHLQYGHAQQLQHQSFRSLATIQERSGLFTGSRPGSSSRKQPTGGSSAYETSLSCYESARGTVGRGTPPPREDGQPRLDDLFRELQVRQEREVRKRLIGQNSSPSNNLQHIPQAKIPGYSAGVSHDLHSFISKQTPLIVHKNSSYLNQGHAHHDHTHHCEWGQCHLRFLSARDLFSHLQEEHISRLPTSIKVQSARNMGQQLLTCEWRGCGGSGRGYMARYKLVMHIKMAHIQKSDSYSTTQQRKPDSHTTFPRNRQQ